MTRSPLIALVALSVALISTVSAADSGTTTTGTQTPVAAPTTQTETPLLLDTVIATDATTVTLVFNQAIRIDSLRVRIIDQATNEAVRVASITGATSPMTAVVRTATPVTAGASYILTITSALSTTDLTIKAGIDSIREFAVPVTLKGASLNAPSNPTAVIASASGTTPKVMTQSGKTQSGTVVPDEATLPATGTSTTIMIILAGIVALWLLVVRKRA